LNNGCVELNNRLGVAHHTEGISQRGCRLVEFRLLHGRKRYDEHKESQQETHHVPVGHDPIVESLFDDDIFALFCHGGPPGASLSGS